MLTSDFEGTPNVILEAMASGIPVVATSVDGIASIIKNGHNGFLVDKNNEDEFALFILSLMYNPELRKTIGKQGLEFVRANHSLKSLPDHLSNLYNFALS